ncbi:MAG TPA: DUF3619 family protein [Caldimonas sp.]|jgi:hypothetical protein|nr:DUF3619 family protein [Caldimonas sp.]HEX4235972.1 DUF3619 family protein [Caldimonas sp.]
MNHDDRSYRAAAREAMEARFARSVAACLSESAEQVSPDVAERLRFGREKALETARHRLGDARELGITASGAAIAGFSQSRWWLRFASVLPLVALVGGLVLIQNLENRAQISVAAEIDEALLGDDLPINAYRDPGFSEFLKAPPSE